MKNSTPRIDRNKKTIYATKSFLIEAGQFGTTEFNKLNNALKENPGFKVEEEKIARNASKEAYYDEEDCQCCYDYVFGTDPEEILMTLEEAGYDWQNLRREYNGFIEEECCCMN